MSMVGGVDIVSRGCGLAVVVLWKGNECKSEMYRKWSRVEIWGRHVKVYWLRSIYIVLNIVVRYVWFQLGILLKFIIMDRYWLRSYNFIV